MNSIVLLLLSLFLFSAPSRASGLLDGIWLQDCHLKNNSDYLTSKLVIEEGQWKHSFVAHEDPECKFGYMIFTVYGKIANSFEDEQDQGDFDLTITKVSYQFLDETDAIMFGINGFCGHSDWVAGEEFFVEGKVCGDYKAPQAGSIIYSKFAYYGVDQLYLGITKVGYIENTLKSRHENLDENSYNRYLDWN